MSSSSTTILSRTLIGWEKIGLGLFDCAALVTFATKGWEKIGLGLFDGAAMVMFATHPPCIFSPRLFQCY